MNLSSGPETDAFRREVREFIAQNLPKDIVEPYQAGFFARFEHIHRWHKILHAKGWAAPGWPVEYGGAGWTAEQKFVFEEEISLARAPRLLPFGLSMVGPVIYTFGSEAQKCRHLPGILSGDVQWCQGYSEPGAGSDLANIRTTAVRDGDHYVVNGQKIWTSFAHLSDWIFCLVRTSAAGKPQEGISFLLIDLKTPGIEIKPIVSIDGLHHLNETFFTDVRVPLDGLVGQEGMGWTYAKFLLQFERSAIAGAAASRVALESLRNAAKAVGLMDDPDFRRKVMEVEVKLTALEYTDFRGLADQAAGKAAGAETSLLKITGTEVQQSLHELGIELAGYYAAPLVPDMLEGGSNALPIGPEWAMPATGMYLLGRAATLYGGTNEIQRGVIAKAVLGL